MPTPLVLLIPLAAALFPAPRPTERITLLPNTDGKPSAIVITSSRGDTLVDRPYLSASVFTSGAVTPQQDEAGAVRARYHTTLAALPQAAADYTVYFDSASDRLAPESAERMLQIRAELARRDQPEIIVAGHADRSDAPGYNDELSMQRAAAVKRMLTAAGIPDEAIGAVAFGSREPQVRVRDGGIEARNRRVDIRVR